MIDVETVHDFLAQKRIAVVGASDDPRKFGWTVYDELRSHGYDVVAVNRNATTVGGDACYPDIASVPGPVDGVIVMVPAPASEDVVDECVRAGVPRIWLFKGLGGPGALSAAAVERAQAGGSVVVAGACPLMFLEPVGWFHRLHRAARKVKGTFGPARPRSQSA